MRRDSPPRPSKLDNNADSSHIPPPAHAQTFGYTGTHVVASLRRGWRPESDGGRHDFPIFSRHRKRPSSSSIDSNSSRESESSSSVTVNDQQQEIKAQQTSPSNKPDVVPVPPPVLASVINAERLAAQPPRTPQGRSTYSTFDDGSLSAAQRVRMELSSHSGSRAGSGSQVNSSEDIFAPSSPVFDEKKDGPRSCPSSYKDVGGNKTRFSPGRGRQVRSGELMVSKLLPTRDTVNSLLTYLHELQISEATLRKQLMTTKQHTEEELYQSLSKLNELQRTMHKVERERQIAEQRLEEKEQRIRELAAKLKKAETIQARLSPARDGGYSSEELPPITEEVSSQEAKTPPSEETPALTLDALLPSTQPSQTAASSLRPPQLQSIKDEAARFEVMSPRSPNRPLWDPWASGDATPMKNLPPVFTIGSTDLDPVVTSPASTEEPAATKTDEYELRSVLMSPRRAQDQDETIESDHPSPQAREQYVTSDLPLEKVESVLIEPQNPAPISSPPTNYSPLQTHDPTEMQEVMPLTELSLRTDPLLYVGAMPPIHESPLEQQEDNSATLDSDADESGLKNNGVSSPGFAKQTPSPLPQAVAANVCSKVTTPHDESTQVTHAEQVSTAEAEYVGASILSDTPLGSTPSSPPMSDVQRDSPTQQGKAIPAEPLSLEALLVDFFTKVDQKRLKMATVYGKRYAGREKWLFAELTKRYGAAKVAALKARYEGGTATSTTSNSGDNSSKQDDHVTKSLDSSDRSKTGRQGHPRHPQFFHPPAPASSLDLGAGMPPVSPPVALSKENNMPNFQRGEEAAETGAPPSPTEKDPVSHRQRRSGSSSPPCTIPPSSFPNTQAIGEIKNEATADTGLSKMIEPPPPVLKEEPTSRFNQPLSAPQSGMETSNPAPLGLRRRHNASVPSTQAQQSAAPAVTLQGLLKELYKNHQPDKLKNVSIVAKQYAGKERELVGLLKGKYGALSVKRLEENLEVLERAHRAHIGDKGAGKKRGCFVRTISLVFWLSVLLYFSFGAVFVSFVVLDAWECRALDNDDQEAESAEECVSLKKELETFTYERVADYMSQSHPEVCFCSEWKAREIALFSNLSGDSLLNLARLVPFSPDSFGSAWIASVKEQVPSQEFYDSYAKPVVDLSLDAGSLVWFSVLELGGNGEVSEQKSQIVEDVENDTSHILSLEEESESGVNTNSLDRASDEVENQSSVSDADSNDHSTEETGTTEELVPSDEVSVDDKALKFDEELSIDEIGIDAKGNVALEEGVPVKGDLATIEEENLPFVSEAVSEEHATVDSTDVVESEDIASFEETESVDANVPSTDADEKEVTETLADNDSTFAPGEQTRFTASDSSSTEREVVNAAVDVAEEVSEAAVEDSLDDVVEVEVLQEGVDLSYAKTATDATDEELPAESSEVPSSVLEAESEPVADVDDGVLSGLSEAESEMDVESGSAVSNSLEESESAEEVMPSTAGAVVEVIEPTSDVSISDEAFDVEIKSVEEGSICSEEFGEEVAPEMREESDAETDDSASESPIPADIDEMPALASKLGEEGVYTTLIEEVGIGTGENDLDTVAKLETATANEEVEVVAFEEDHASIDKATISADFESAVPAETDASISGLESAEDVAGGPDEPALQEYAGKLDNEDFRQNDIREVSSFVELVAVGGADKLTTAFEAGTETLEYVVDNGAEPSTGQPLTEVDVVNELGEQPVAIEAPEASVEVVIDAAKPVEANDEEMTRDVVANSDDSGNDDIEEEEEIAFMEDLEYPEELLRMAEQAAAAAAAEFLTMESR